MLAFNRTFLFTIIVSLSVFYQLTSAEDPPSTTTATTTSSSISNGNDNTTVTTLSSSTSSIAVSSSTNSTTMDTGTSDTDSTSPITTTTTTPSGSINPTSTTTTLSVITTTSNATITTTTSNVTTTKLDNGATPSSDERTGPGWWLLVGLLITIAIVFIAGVIFHYRQQSPYRRFMSCGQCCRSCDSRFLQNWRSRDDDTDNIILQLEQSDTPQDQWPPRISFT